MVGKCPLAVRPQMAGLETPRRDDRPQTGAGALFRGQWRHAARTGQSSGGPGALPVPERGGHTLPHPWRLRAEISWQGGVIRLHPSAGSGCHRPLRPCAPWRHGPCPACRNARRTFGHLLRKSPGRRFQGAAPACHKGRGCVSDPHHHHGLGCKPRVALPAADPPDNLNKPGCEQMCGPMQPHSRERICHVFFRYLPRPVARQYSARPSVGPCRRAGADPRGHRLFHHRGRGPEGRALRQLLDCRHHRHRGRAARHDFRRNRRNRRADGDTGEGPRAAIPAGRHGSGGPSANRHGADASGLRHALCVEIRDDGFRERAGHPDLSGAIARAGPAPRAAFDLCAAGRCPCHHLSVPAPHPRRAVASGGDCGADGCDPRPGAGGADRGRHGRAARYAAGVPAARRAAEP
ncbi:UNVERIFIED_CONTAM: hypothetical protein NCL1_09118 [Trichonephila clavipes]